MESAVKATFALIAESRPFNFFDIFSRSFTFDQFRQAYAF